MNLKIGKNIVFGRKFIPKNPLAPKFLKIGRGLHPISLSNLFFYRLEPILCRCVLKLNAASRRSSQSLTGEDKFIALIALDNAIFSAPGQLYTLMNQKNYLWKNIRHLTICVHYFYKIYSNQYYRAFINFDFEIEILLFSYYQKVMSMLFHQVLVFINFWFLLSQH